MVRPHVFLDDKLVYRLRMEHVPRVGETVRFSGNVYAKVSEIVWCLDEDWSGGQRVNIRCESLAEEKPNEL